ncbi:MAG: hypothetical protein ACREIY_07105 [Candidatus Rokuibacteriota bacterium]
MALVSLLAAGALAGCAGGRIEGGMYHSPKGYRVALPGAPWTVAEDSRADLELRLRAAPAAMLVNASCDGPAAAPGLDALARHLLMGFQRRTTVERGEVAVNGRRAAHTVLEGRLAAGDAPVRVETYVMKDARCVYDFAYAAPPAAFETGRAAFRRLVESFATE